MSAKIDDPITDEQIYAGDVHRPMNIRAMMTMIVDPGDIVHGDVLGGCFLLRATLSTY